jgi:hypothetical protein
MRCADVGRSEHVPFRIVPERVKVGEHAGKSSRDKRGRVFSEHERRTYFPDNARHFAPET